MDIKQMQALVSKTQVDKARQIVADFEKRGAKRKSYSRDNIGK